MALQKYVSDIKVIEQNQEIVYNYLSNFENLSVITSYSIHYTKLYERKPSSNFCWSFSRRSYYFSFSNLSFLRPTSFCSAKPLTQSRVISTLATT